MPPSYGQPQPGPGYPGQPSQPPHAAPQPPYGYPQQPGYGAPQPYYQAPQGYGAPSPYAGAMPPQKEAKNPLLGRIALALVLVALAAAVFYTGPIATVLSQMIVSTGSTSLDGNVLGDALMSSAGGSVGVLNLAITVGTVAMIAGLVAGISGRGRASGWIAFVVGLLSPVIWGIYLAFLIMPAMEAVAR